MDSNNGFTIVRLYITKNKHLFNELESKYVLL